MLFFNSSEKYLISDGIILPSDSLLFDSKNSLIKNGDGFFEIMRYHRGEVLFFDLHLKKILKAMGIMLLNISSLPLNSLHQSIISLITRNRIFGDAAVRLTVYRTSKPFETFESSIFPASWLIEVSSISEKNYTFDDAGMIVNVYSNFKKQPSPISEFNVTSPFPYFFAKIEAKKHNHSDALIVNHDNKIIETSASNIFTITGEKIQTPKVDTGCIDGILRSKLITFLRETNWQVVEINGFNTETINNSDEIFCVDVIHGIRRISGIGQKRFYGRKLKKIGEEFFEVKS